MLHDVRCIGVVKCHTVTDWDRRWELNYNNSIGDYCTKYLKYEIEWKQ